MRVVVTGARGLLGAAITREFGRVAEVHAHDHTTLDLTNEARVRETVHGVRPTAVINCAAYNDVDGAEDHAQMALEVNALGVLTIANCAREVDSVLVHYSTDFVFDGETRRPYTENDGPSPRSFYGLSKLLGEFFALEHPRAYVLRVESLFGDPASGAARRGSLHTIIARIIAGEDVPVFVDRTVSPAYTIDVAAATRSLLEKNATSGVYHCVNSGTATWAEIAAEAARLLGRPLRTREMTLQDAGLKARRPRYCALSNEKLAAAGVRMPHWRDALQRYLADRA